MAKKSDPLKSFYDQILNYEKQIEELKEEKKKWYSRFKSLKSANERIGKTAVNKSELEHLRVENSKLLMELNKSQRANKNLEDKLSQIKVLCK